MQNRNIHTFLTAVQVIDSFWMTQQFKNLYKSADLNLLIGFTALYISSKYWEVEPMSLDSLSKNYLNGKFKEI